MGILDRSSLNDRLNNPDNWKGTDDDVWYMRWCLKIKCWFAFSNRSPEGIAFSFVIFPFMYLFPFTVWFTGWSWWYLLPVAIIPVMRKWRVKPKILWAWKWGGFWRWETASEMRDGLLYVVGTNISLTNDHDGFSSQPDPTQSLINFDDAMYLSRIQPWSRMSMILFWPLCVAVTFFPHERNVGTPYGLKHQENSEIYFYRGWHFDDDLVFWGDGGAGPHFK